MKKLLLLLVSLTILNVNATSLIEPGDLPSEDGLSNANCFQLYVPGALYPVLCLDGIYNEIGRFKVSTIGPNSEVVNSCSIHYAASGDLKLDSTSLELYSNAGKIFQFKMEPTDATFKEGKLTFPSGAVINFLKIDNVRKSSLLDIVHESGVCNKN